MENQNTPQLKIEKEKIAVLNEDEISAIQGGKELPGLPGNGSTNYNFTCTWCTGILPVID